MIPLLDRGRGASVDARSGKCSIVVHAATLCKRERSARARRSRPRRGRRLRGRRRADAGDCVELLAASAAHRPAAGGRPLRRVTVASLAVARAALR